MNQIFTAPTTLPAEPEDVFVLRMGGEAEPHTAATIIERLRGLMYHGQIMPGYSVDRWYWSEGGWIRYDDEWSADDDD